MRTQKLFVVFFGLITIAMVANAQVNMDRYIKLNVQTGQQINIELFPDSGNTSVKIVSGATDTTFVLDAGGVTNSYKTGSNTMSIYGNIISLDCSNNGKKITGINASNNLGLEYLYCSSDSIDTLNVNGLAKLIILQCDSILAQYLDVSGLTNLNWLFCSNMPIRELDISGLKDLTSIDCSNTKIKFLDLNGSAKLTVIDCHNTLVKALDISKLPELEGLSFYNTPLSLSSSAIDSIYCLLPNRINSSYKGNICPVENNTSANHEAVIATNKTNATNKGWYVIYSNTDSISATTGTYACTVDIKDMAINNVFANIYPNPIVNTIYIHGKNISSVMIFNSLGEMIIAAENKSDIDVSSLSAGIYFIRIFNNKHESISKKIIIEK